MIVRNCWIIYKLLFFFFLQPLTWLKQGFYITNNKTEHTELSQKVCEFFGQNMKFEVYLLSEVKRVTLFTRFHHMPLKNWTKS